MEGNTTTFSFRQISTALLVSTLALFISVIAFVALYRTDDSFWAEVCLCVVVPVALLAATLLTLRDALKRRIFRETVAVLVLVVTCASLIATANTIRFAFHQLFTFGPVDLGGPAENGSVFFEKFTVCPQGRSCQPRSTVTETRTFRLKRMPADCCLLSVVNARKQPVAAFHVTFNGRQVELPERLVTRVELRTENQISVQLSGVPGAHLYVVIFPREYLRNDALSSMTYGDQSNTRGTLQTTCTVPVPTAIQNRLRSQFRAFELQTAENLSLAAKARWKWEGAMCPGLVAGDFEGRGVHSWAALLVPRDRKAQGSRFVVFRAGASNADFTEAVLDQADYGGNPHDLFIKSVQANQVFDEASRVKFGIHAEQALEFFAVGEQEYEVDVYYWARGQYQHTPIDY